MIMNIYYTIEEKYLKAEQKLNWGNTPKAKLLLEEILENEPAYGKAHYLLACIYYFDLAEYDLAKRHFDLAIKFSPNFPKTYYRYMTMLTDLGLKKHLLNLAEEAIKVNGICKAEVNFYQGQIYEKEKDWNKAIQFYREAYQNSICEDDLLRFEKDIDRVDKKINSLKKWKYVTA